MARLMAIDYGTKRIGIAVTDPGQIIATALDTVHSKDVIEFLRNYFSREEVECIVVGDPRQMDNTGSEISRLVDNFVKELKRKFPAIPIDRYDERFTSVIARDSILMSGLKKSDRRKKELIDQTSAVILLQSYMEYRKNKL
ncbi:MAG: Holliday junction resolvase RuvX [Bacteroidia bacterium]